MRIWKVIKHSISIILILTLVFQFPLSTLAAALECGSITLRPIESEAVIDTSPIQKETDESEIVAEIESKRTEYSKEYLLSNGLHMAAVYADAVHYETEDGWKDIDNTLKTEGTGTSRVYANTAGVWNVQLPQQLTKNNAVTVTKDGYTLSFTPAGELRTSGQLETMRLNGQAEAFSTTAFTAANAQIIPIESTVSDGLTLTKLQSRLQYSNVFNNTHIVYDLQGNRLKESIVIDSYSSALRGYRYTLNTGGMIPVLAESGRIDLYDRTGETIVMCMPAPFLVDSAQKMNYDVQVTLTQSGSQYILTYLLPQQWLASQERSWPVILDPVVDANTSRDNIDDQSVCEKKPLDPEWGVIQVGYYPSEGVSRCFLKYNNLPALSSADVVIRATIELYLLETFNDSHQVEVHKVEDVWEEDTITWSNKPSTNSTIEDFQMVRYAGYYYWNVTDIVQEWYQGENTGMMFKMSDEVEAAQVTEWRQFRSSEYGTVRPSLSIVFRNNNGLESYWDYTTVAADRAGTGYINNYTGNLVWVRNDIGFSGNRMPVSISHIYNANDRIDANSQENNADETAGNAFGMGYGWRTNYNQLVYRWSEDNDYYVWEDSDGTDHYFYYKSSGTYKDEDGLELTLTTTGSGDKKYTITDKQDNKSYFDTSGRLTKIENNQKVTSSIDITYTSADSKKIDTVTDGAGRDYVFTYTNGLLSRISYKGTGTVEISYVSYEYENGQLTEITDKDGKKVQYVYDTEHRLEVVKNIDIDPEPNTDSDVVGYNLSFQYTTVDAGQPSRVAQVTEADGNLAGGELHFAYSNNQTTVTDHNGITNIYQFNNFGNTICIQDGEGRAQYTQYALSDSTDNSNTDTTKKANQLRVSSKLQNTVGNYLSDSSFEMHTEWTPLDNTVHCHGTDSAGFHYYGTSCLYINKLEAGAPSGVYADSFSAYPGLSYTLSGYVCNPPSSVYLALSDGTTTVTSDVLVPQVDWVRLEVTYTNETETVKTVTPYLYTTEEDYVFLDDVQLECAPTASRYNLIENGDFRYGTSGWDQATMTADGLATADTPAAPQLESTVLKMTGRPAGYRQLVQYLSISGDAGDSYVVAGWAKGESVPIGNIGGDDRTFQIDLALHNHDGTVTYATAKFNPDSDQWQYSAAVAVAEKAYHSMAVVVRYNFNANTAYFDGIQLFKEEFGNSYTYDEDGNVISVKDLQKQETTYEYDTNNNLTEIIQNGQAKMTYEYDQWHNVIEATTQEGLTYEFAYDDYGNNIAVSISDGTYTMTSAAVYSTDDHNRLEKTVDALGKETLYGYNADTNVLEWVQYPNDSEQTRTEYEYDTMYRTASAACATDTGLNLSAEYVYENDLLTKIETPSTHYNFTYGDFSLTSGVSVGNRNLVTYHYQEEVSRGEEDDRNYDLDRLAYANGDYIDYAYDKLGRLTQETYENGATVEYRYDNNGSLAQIEDKSTGITTKYYYDFTDRMMKYTETGTDYSHSVGYEYDTKNNLTKLVEIINGVESTSSYIYDDDNRIFAVTNGEVAIYYHYDSLGRVHYREITQDDAFVFFEYFYYTAAPSDDPDLSGTSAQISSYRILVGGYNFTYTYDNNGNITSVSDGTYTTSYVYDSANQLIRENNQAGNYTHTWTYDNAGNILNRKEYAYTTGTLGTPTDTVTYTYGDEQWGDLLTAYDGNTITYDNVGNPLSDGEWTYTWENGRQLASMTNGSATWTYAYNADGMRISKTNGSATYHYVYNGSQLSQMTEGNNTLTFTYDASGKPVTVTYNGTTYFYATSIQGDVFAIMDANAHTVVTYSYDAWGNLLSLTGDMANTLGAINPLRYRGYVYDTETGLYYVSSRYYDPEMGRWINADNQIAGVGGELLGYNMFAYCMNNPVNMSDPTGNWPQWLSGALNVIGGFAQGALGAVIGATVGWTGVGAVAAGALILNGAATATQGMGQIINSVTNSNIMREDNIIRTGVQEFGDMLAGDTGAEVAGMLYDTAILTAALYSPPTYASPTSSAIPAGGACFIAGTIILTENGLETIEHICVGDMVWSQNTETGEKSLKEVLQIFVRETNTLIYIDINGEEIITTPEHPFFVYGKGWVTANNLCIGDILTTQEGDFVTILKVRYQLLHYPITVYNFEVADFHTYYVGNNSVLVHNSCEPDSPVKLNNNALRGIDAHTFKQEFVGRSVARWDIYKDTANNSILWLGNKTQTVWMATGYFLKDLIKLFPSK